MSLGPCASDIRSAPAPYEICARPCHGWVCGAACTAPFLRQGYALRTVPYVVRTLGSIDGAIALLPEILTGGSQQVGWPDRPIGPASWLVVRASIGQHL